MSTSSKTNASDLRVFYDLFANPRVFKPPLPFNKNVEIVIPIQDAFALTMSELDEFVRPESPKVKPFRKHTRNGSAVLIAPPETSDANAAWLKSEDTSFKHGSMSILKKTSTSPPKKTPTSPYKKTPTRPHKKSTFIERAHKKKLLLSKEPVTEKRVKDTTGQPLSPKDPAPEEYKKDVFPQIYISEYEKQRMVNDRSYMFVHGIDFSLLSMADCPANLPIEKWTLTELIKLICCYNRPKDLPLPKLHRITHLHRYGDALQIEFLCEFIKSGIVRGFWIPYAALVHVEDIRTMLSDVLKFNCAIDIHEHMERIKSATNGFCPTDTEIEEYQKTHVRYPESWTKSQYKVHPISCLNKRTIHAVDDRTITGIGIHVPIDPGMCNRNAIAHVSDVDKLVELLKFASRDIDEMPYKVAIISDATAFGGPDDKALERLLCFYLPKHSSTIVYPKCLVNAGPGVPVMRAFAAANKVRFAECFAEAAKAGAPYGDTVRRCMQELHEHKEYHKFPIAQLIWWLTKRKMLLQHYTLSPFSIDRLFNGALAHDGEDIEKPNCTELWGSCMTFTCCDCSHKISKYTLVMAIYNSGKLDCPECPSGMLVPDLKIPTTDISEAGKRKLKGDISTANVVIVIGSNYLQTSEWMTNVLGTTKENVISIKDSTMVSSSRELAGPVEHVLRNLVDMLNHN